MSVHYKFKSSLDYDTVTFDGLHISVADLKKAILQQKKIGKGFDFDLKITNAQTKEIYSEDDCLIPKNASVIVSRVPTSSNSGKKGWDRNDSPSLLPAVANNDSDSVAFDKVTKSADLVSANASEDEKIRAMMSQSTQEYDPSRYVKTKTMVGPTPTNYTCYRCGRTGHWIKNCPTNAMDVKRSTGIPRSFMVTVDGPDVPGALLTSTGHYAVPMIDHEAYKEGKKERPPFAKEVSPVKEEQSKIPEELLCMICRDLLTDAVLISCCGNSYCDECVRQALLDSDEHECPTCHEKDISPDTLIPVRLLRTAVMNFKNETGYIKSKKLVEVKPVDINEPGCSSTLTEAELAEQALALATTENNKENVVDLKEPVKLDHPDTPVRDELAEVSALPEVNNDVILQDVLPKEPEAFSIKTITTRQQGVSSVPMMPNMKMNRMPLLRDGPYAHDPYMDPNLRHSHHGSHREMDSMRMGPPSHMSHNMGGPQMHHMGYRSHMSQPPPHQFQPNYRPPPQMMKPPPLQRGMPMPPHMNNVHQPPPNHMMGMPHPNQFYSQLRHPPPPVPNNFNGPPPSTLPHRRPLPPPSGSNPITSQSQPLPPGVRPPTTTASTSHTIQQPPANFHPGMPPPYPPRTEDYYQDSRNYSDRERPAHDPLDAFARELFDYRRDDRGSRRRSASSSYSSRSRSRSGSRSRSHSRDSRSRSKSRSYSSRSRSGSGSYSRSRSRSHHRSRSPTSRSRSRSRSKGRSKYSPPSKRRGNNRSRSNSRERSPILSNKPQPQSSSLPANRRRREREYSPNNPYVYHRDIPSNSGGPPSSHAGNAQQPVHPPPPPYDVHRGRYMDNYRYDAYNHHGAYEEDPRYMRDPRYDYLRYDDYNYHQQGMPSTRPMRGNWPEQQSSPDMRARTGREASQNMRRPGHSKRSRSREPSIDRRNQQHSSNNSAKEKKRSRSRSAPRGSRGGDREADRDRSKAKSRHDERDSKSNYSSSRRGANYKDYSSNNISKDSQTNHKTTESSLKDAESKVTEDSKMNSHSEKHKDKKHKRSKGHHDADSHGKKSKSGRKSSSEVDTEADSASGDVSRKSGSKKRKQKNKENEHSAKSRSEKEEQGGEKPLIKDEGLDNTSALPPQSADAQNAWSEDADNVISKSGSKDDVAEMSEHNSLLYPEEAQSDLAIDAESRTDEESKVEAEFDDLAQLESVEASEAEPEDEDERENVEEESYQMGEEIDEEAEMDAENEEVDEEEQKSYSASGEGDNESVLTALVPELSKWERDDIDVNKPDDNSISFSQQRGKIKLDVVKQTLPADIVQRAEKAILEKAPKAIITETRIVGKSVDIGVKDKEQFLKINNLEKQVSSNRRSVDRSETEKKELDVVRNRSERSKNRDTPRPGSSNSKRSVSAERKREKGRSRERSRSVDKDRRRRRSNERERSRDRNRRYRSRSKSREDARSSRYRDRSDDSRSKVSGGKMDRDNFREKRDYKKENSEDRGRRKSRSPVNAKSKKSVDEKRLKPDEKNEAETNSAKNKRERKPSTAASTIDESKFEPDYDTPTDEEDNRPKEEKVEKNQGTTIIKNEENKRRSSSSSSSSGSNSSAESTASSPAKKKRRKMSSDEKEKSSTTEKSSKHKNKKHKKHKKHKHKHKKSKKSHKHKDESGNKDSESKGKSKSKH